MTRESFQKSFMALVAAKLQTPDPEFVKAKRDVYYAMLKEIPDADWEKAVAHCLRHGTFFPSIEELGEAAMGEQYDYNPVSGCKKIPWETALKRQIQRRELPGARKVLEAIQKGGDDGK